MAKPTPPSRLIEAFRVTAQTLAARKITGCPLGFDDDGFAKVPLSDSYATFCPEDNLSHDWSAAAGLGIVLGKPSGNLAAIDVDEVGLAEFLLRHLRARQAPPLMVWTARDRFHVYVVEPTTSPPLDLEASYQGRRCLVQLLAAGCQVAAPPTPGYRWLDARAEPLYGTVGASWHRIAKELGLFYRAAVPIHSCGANARVDRRRRNSGRRRGGNPRRTRVLESYSNPLRPQPRRRLAR